MAAWSACLLARCCPTLLVRSLLNASDDLNSIKANQRFSFVRRHPEQMAFFRKLVPTGTPLSVRQPGLWNDLRQFAELPHYPLERISCPRLVVHGSADGNVPLSHAQFVAKAVPNAELLAVEDCGHFIWVGPESEQTRQKVVAFVNRFAALSCNRNASGKFPDAAP
jgi:pimeloyl-ACP methyl ester carboxylesterase